MLFTQSELEVSLDVSLPLKLFVVVFVVGGGDGGGCDHVRTLHRCVRVCVRLFFPPFLSYLLSAFQEFPQILYLLIAQFLDLLSCAAKDLFIVKYIFYC